MNDIKWLASRLARLERRQRSTDRGSQAARRTVVLSDGSADVVDDDGNVIGRTAVDEESGLATYQPVSGEPPAQPTPPDVEASIESVIVSWDGTFEEANWSPGIARVEIHRFENEFDTNADDTTQVGTFVSPMGGVQAFDAPVGVTLYYRLQAVSAAGVEGLVSEPFPCTALVNPTDQISVDLEDLANSLEELDGELTIAEGTLTALDTIVIPGLISDIEDANYQIGQLNSVTIPDLQDELAAANLAIADLDAFADGVFPITETDIQDGAITTPKMTANSINGDRILANTLNALKIVAGSITTDRMTSNTINGDRITANTLAAAKIVAGSITTDRMTANTINGDRITANTLNASKIVAGSITTDRMTANTIHGDRITTNTLHADKIVAGSITTDKLAANAIDAMTITGALYRSSATGPRVEIGDDDYQSSVFWYTSTGDLYPGEITVAEGSIGTGLVIRSNSISTSGWGPSSVFMLPSLGAAADANGLNAHTAYGELYVNAYSPMVEMPWIHGSVDGPYGIRYDQDSGYSQDFTRDTGFSLTSGWVSASAAQAVRLYRDAAGRVEMRGAVLRGSKASGSILFTLPPAWRPKTTTYAMVRTNNSVAIAGQITIQSDGGVYLSWTGSTNPTSLGVDCDWSTFF